MTFFFNSAFLKSCCLRQEFDFCFDNVAFAIH